MSSTSGPRRKPAYDPSRQWGLKPPEAREPGSSATYVISGHTVNGPGSDSSSMYVAESMGREGQAKAKRKLAGKDADRALKTLLERDKEGMKAVVAARTFAMQENHEQGNSAKREKTIKGKGVAKAQDKDCEDESARISESATSKHSYSAEVIKQLGFDPAVRAGHRRPGDSAIQKKVRSCQLELWSTSVR